MCSNSLSPVHPIDNPYINKKKKMMKFPQSKIRNFDETNIFLFFSSKTMLILRKIKTAMVRKAGSPKRCSDMLGVLWY
jgi:hypothetical protein